MMKKNKMPCNPKLHRMYEILNMKKKAERSIKFNFRADATFQEVWTNVAEKCRQTKAELMICSIKKGMKLRTLKRIPYEIDKNRDKVLSIRLPVYLAERLWKEKYPGDALRYYSTLGMAYASEKALPEVPLKIDKAELKAFKAIAKAEEYWKEKEFKILGKILKLETKLLKS